MTALRFARLARQIAAFEPKTPTAPDDRHHPAVVVLVVSVIVVVVVVVV